MPSYMLFEWQNTKHFVRACVITNCSNQPDIAKEYIQKVKKEQIWICESHFPTNYGKYCKLGNASSVNSYSIYSNLYKIFSLHLLRVNRVKEN